MHPIVGCCAAVHTSFLNTVNVPSHKKLVYTHTVEDPPTPATQSQTGDCALKMPHVCGKMHPRLCTFSRSPPAPATRQITGAPRARAQRAARTRHTAYIHLRDPQSAQGQTPARHETDRREREREDTTRTRPRRNSYIVVVVYYFCGVPPALLLGEVSAARSPEFLSLNAGSPLQRMIKPDRINPMPKEYPVSRSSPWPSPSPITTRPADCGECTR